jgi:peptide/nickel transport system permease protein
MSFALQAGLGFLRQAMLLAGIAIAVFLLIRIVPGDVVDSMALEGSLDDEAIAALRAELGLDAGTLTQFRIWVSRALVGDFGNSLRFDRPASELILAALPTTLGLAALALAAGLALGIVMAAAAALWPGSAVPSLVASPPSWSFQSGSAGCRSSGSGCRRYSSSRLISQDRSQSRCMRI